MKPIYSLDPTMRQTSGPVINYLGQEEDMEPITCRDCYELVKNEGDLCPSCAAAEAEYQVGLRMDQGIKNEQIGIW